ncbi:hypothetical protein [Microcystis phage Mel-JY01]
MQFKQYILGESSLSRIFSYLDKYDCGIITAFRSRENCGDNKKFSKKLGKTIWKDKPINIQQNKQRNKTLKQQLLSLGYTVTDAKGVYIEKYGTPQAVNVSEDVFFVVDMAGKGTLEADLRKLGEQWNQDSVLYFPLGGRGSILIGTSKCKGLFLGYGEKKSFNDRKIGTPGMFHTRVAGRPFTFGETYVPWKKIINESITGEIISPLKYCVFIDTAQYITRGSGLLTFMFAQDSSIGSAIISKLYRQFSASDLYKQNAESFKSIGARFSANPTLKTLYIAARKIMSKISTGDGDIEENKKDLGVVMRRIEKFISSKLTEQDNQLFATVSGDMAKIATNFAGVIDNNVKAPEPMPEPMPEPTEPEKKDEPAEKEPEKKKEEPKKDSDSNKTDSPAPKKSDKSEGMKITREQLKEKIRIIVKRVLNEAMK